MLPALLLAAVGQGISSASASEPARPPEDLYAAHCAVCHGARGRADGEAARFLFPPARNFSRGAFRLVSSANGAPTERDLVATLKRGIPGSSMPSFHWLTDAELAGLAGYVRELAIEGLTEQLVIAEASDASGSPEGPRRHATERLTPGAPLAELLPVEDFDQAVVRGRELYASNCARCHLEDGSGGREPRWDDDGGLNWARDFTRGYMKGGLSRQDIAHRIQAGMPGSAMPATQLGSPEDLAALVEYVRTLIPEDPLSLVLRRQRLTAERVNALGDITHDDPRWKSPGRVFVRLTPLWWREASILEVKLSALHDGSSLAIRARWPDETSQPRIFSDANRSDGIALQFSSAERPPLFGMGATDNPTSIWHWQAVRLDDVAGWMDLLEPPHLTGSHQVPAVRVQSPVYHRLAGLPVVSARVEQIEGRGIPTRRKGTTQPSDVRIEARSDGKEWDVIFLRQMEPPSERDIEFLMGDEVQMAVAIWNGAAGDTGPQKSISIWQSLLLEP